MVALWWQSWHDLARRDQFAGGGGQIGKGRRCGHALPADQPAPPWSSCILQGSTQAVQLLPVFLGFRMPLLMKSIDPGGHVARMLPFCLQFTLKPIGG